MSKLDTITAKNPYLLKSKSRVPKGMQPPKNITNPGSEALKKAKLDKDYDVNLSTQSKELEQNLNQKMETLTPKAPSVPKIDIPNISPEDEVIKEIGKKALEKVTKVEKKEYWTKEEPVILFISGFEMFGASSSDGDYDGIPEMAKAIDHAKLFNWDQEEEILEHIKMHQINQPLVIVGHSFGADTAVAIANELNSVENKFRTIDLMVTLDSVGMNNDEIPENVRTNLNYIGNDSFSFLNDGPNIAKDYETTFVQNFLRKDGHKQLDDAPDIQKTILDAVGKLT